METTDHHHHRVLAHNESKLKKKKDIPITNTSADAGGGGGGGGAGASGHRRDEDDERRVFEDIHQFLVALKDHQQNQPNSNDDQPPPPPQLPGSSIDKMLSFVSEDLSRYESFRDGGSDNNRWPLEFLDHVDLVLGLSTSLSAFNSSPDNNYKNATVKTSVLLQHVVSFLEEEFKLLLEELNSSSGGGGGGSVSTTNRAHSTRHGGGKLSLRLRDPIADSSSPSSPRTTEDAADDYHEPGPPPYPPETVNKLHRIASLMISAGCLSECFQAFSIIRQRAFDAFLSNLGFHRIANIDDLHKMQWKQLQAEISSWTKAFRRSISVLFPREHDLLESVFGDEHRGVAVNLFNNLTRGVIIQLLNFTEAVTSTNGSFERLFKYLEMYEALRSVLPELDALFPVKEEVADLKSEISTARGRIGEAAAASFVDFECTIKSDVAKNPASGGGIHPLTRNVMNHLRNASEYREALEQIFDDKATQKRADLASDHAPLAGQMIRMMELLDSNLDAKSKLYKEVALSNIFLMNNGRYINKKIKECNDIYEVVGEKWYRKRSAELRQYHKNYQRESWSKIMGCFRDEGMNNAKEKISRAALKERIKSFNALFDEIVKTQSSWVVCDEQLKSELKVSISAVLVPAYRSFLVKYRHNVTGKTSEKHIKFAAEDIENKIEELFEGSPSSHGRKW